MHQHATRAYGDHWGRHHTSGRDEWHVQWSDLVHALRPYLHPLDPASAGSTVLDIGCGTSSLGLQLADALGSRHLIALDVAAGVLEAAASRRPHQQHHASKPVFMLADCRWLPLRSGSIEWVIDKGTLDALWSDADKVAMLDECARVVARPGGMVLSVSFASPARLRLLAAHAPRLNLRVRVFVLGPGDPAAGHEVRFLTLLSEDFGTASTRATDVGRDDCRDARGGPSRDSVPYVVDGLTARVLARLRRTGSLLDRDGGEPAGQWASVKQPGTQPRPHAAGAREAPATCEWLPAGHAQAAAMAEDAGRVVVAGQGQLDEAVQSLMRAEAAGALLSWVAGSEVRDEFTAALMSTSALFE